MRSLFAGALLFVLVVPNTALASRHGGNGNDRASFGHDITIEPGETVGDVACAFCTVHLRGDVRGDVAVLLGSVQADAGRTISGDVAVLGGDVSLGERASVEGDIAVGAGDLELASEASVRGDRAVAPGRFWLLLPFAPLLVLAGIIWLIVWAIRRNRRPMYPYYPPAVR